MLREAAETIRDGIPGDFEGGTRRRSIKPFKGGGFMLATKSEAAVVPITIRGSRPVLVPRTYHVRSGAVDVIVGEPVPSQGVSASELANRVHEEVLTTFKYGKTLDRNSYSVPREV
jgi:1-acyl-sn-glycerol-3-phosphate acyltransferase